MGQITIKFSLNKLVKEKNDIVINIEDEMSKSVDNNCQKTKLIFHFMEDIIKKLAESGNVRTSETYKCALNSFRRYRNGTDVDFANLTGDMVEDYEIYLKKNNIALNTISFYMRILRAVYNRAIVKGYISDCRPFRNVYTSIGKTVKRAVDINVIRKLMVMNCQNSEENFARDMFMFSFYTRGMSFVDMAYLKKTDITDGVLIYKRKKTGQQLVIQWDGQMQEIVDRNRSMSDVYLLPIITKENGKERNQYRYKQYVVNEDLKKISEDLRLPHNLTMYVARHSWATIARNMDVPLDVISRGMGHNSEKTTQIYLKTIDSGTIDKANALIINALKA